MVAERIAEKSFVVYWNQRVCVEAIREFAEVVSAKLHAKADEFKIPNDEWCGDEYDDTARRSETTYRDAAELLLREAGIEDGSDGVTVRFEE